MVHNDVGSIFRLLDLTKASETGFDAFFDLRLNKRMSK